MPAILLTPLPVWPERQADMVWYRGQCFTAHRQAPVQTVLRRNLKLVTRTNITPYLRPPFTLGYLKKAGLHVWVRTKFTERSNERLAMLFDNWKAKDGDSQELRALTATIQRVV